MKTQVKFVIFYAILFTFCSPVFAVEPANLHTAKKQAESYHDSGAYLSDIAHGVMQAEQYLQQRVTQNMRSSHPKKLAAVFDIDETSLSNYADMLKLDFGGTPTMIDAEIAKADDPALSPTLHLYWLAQKEGVAVFFITGRKAYLCQSTIKNLHMAGYSTWSGLSFKPNHYAQMSVIPYKSSERAKIVQAGYDIILNIGDQQSDLAGGYTDKTFKLPNPYYFIP